MDRDAVDAELGDQIRDLRRERGGWCREKLGVNPLDWLPAVGGREGIGEAKKEKPMSETETKRMVPVMCNVCACRLGWAEVDEAADDVVWVICRACRFSLYNDPQGADDAD